MKFQLFSKKEMMASGTVLISGGTGLIGSELAPLLKSAGWRLHLLSRHGNKLPGWDASFRWNPDQGTMDMQALEGVTHVIHLAGAGIAEKRWTAARKKVILESRVRSAELLKEGLVKTGQKLEAFVSASGVGWYGMKSDQKLHKEDEDAADDFLGHTCRVWEKSANEFSGLAERIVLLRTGIVLAKQGGALPALMMPFKFYAGCFIGKGSQQMPWIHIRDLCRIYAEALENKAWTGAVNAVATEHCSHAEFMKTLAEALRKPIWPVHIPALALKMVLGELSGVITEGSAVSMEKLKKMGFRISYNDLKIALNDILS